MVDSRLDSVQHGGGMATTVSVTDAKTNLSELLRRVAMGEEFVIARAGRPIARLSRYEHGDEPRVEGQDAGSFVVPEDFTDPLPDHDYPGGNGLGLHHGTSRAPRSWVAAARRA